MLYNTIADIRFSVLQNETFWCFFCCECFRLINHEINLMWILLEHVLIEDWMIVKQSCSNFSYLVDQIFFTFLHWEFLALWKCFKAELLFKDLKFDSNAFSSHFIFTTFSEIFLNCSNLILLPKKKSQTTFIKNKLLKSFSNSLNFFF